ncbi:MAG: 4-hydroxythreonine-4-phosphate dehydrogenase PdxA [Methylocystis sp.]
MIKRAPIALTMGDPAGIGPEILLKAYAAREALELPPFYVVADGTFLKAQARQLDLAVEINITEPKEAPQVFSTALPVRSLGVSVEANVGEADQKNARSVILSIEEAVRDVVAHQARALVTNPIAKSVLYSAGFPHPGHTEFLADCAARHYGGSYRAVMMLWSEELAVVPLTIHIPFSLVPKQLTQELIIASGEIVAKDLQKYFKIPNPRLAFSGLNPHAGEDGAMGREEIDVLMPAISALRSKGIRATGPYPADTLFHAAARQAYDVALCPTHDQALIPIKTLAFDRGVNVTLGLPFVRTSPDHGTAFNIARKNTADPKSLIEAIRLADRMTS